jgi:hypothetical protein
MTTNEHRDYSQTVFAAEITALDAEVPAGTRGSVMHDKGDVWFFSYIPREENRRHQSVGIAIHRTAFAITETIERPAVQR